MSQLSSYELEVLVENSWQQLKTHHETRKQFMRRLGSRTNIPSTIEAVAQEEKTINNLFQEFDKLNNLTNSISPTERTKNLLREVDNVKKEFHWAKYPIFISNLPGIRLSRGQLMRFWKETKTGKMSIDPVCKSLYATYHQSCKNCAIALKLPIIKDDENLDSHIFRIGDLSILFYIFKKVLVRADDKKVCEVAQVLCKETRSLLDCIKDRMLHHNYCMEDKPASIEKAQIHKFGDYGHFLFSLYTCFEALSFLETIDAVIERSCYDTKLKEDLNKLCEEYKSVFFNCETFVRQQLNLSRVQENVKIGSYKELVSNSVIFNQLIHNASQPVELLEKHVELLKSLGEDLKLLRLDKIHISQYVTNNFLRGKQLDALGIIDSSFFPFPYSYKYAGYWINGRLYDVPNYEKTEEFSKLLKIFKLGKSLQPQAQYTYYQREEEKFVVEAFQDHINYINKTYNLNEIFDPNVVMTQLSDKNDLLRQNILEHLVDNKYDRHIYEIEKTLTTAKETHQNKYVFNRILDTNQREKLFDSLIKKGDYVSLILDFLSDRFSPIGVQIDFKYDPEEHMRMIEDMLGRTDGIRPCKILEKEEPRLKNQKHKGASRPKERYIPRKTEYYRKMA